MRKFGSGASPHYEKTGCAEQEYPRNDCFADCQAKGERRVNPGLGELSKPLLSPADKKGPVKVQCYEDRWKEELARRGGNS